MDAAQALADLTEISAQIEAAVLADHDGSVVASTLGDEAAAKSFAEAAAELLAAADEVRTEPGSTPSSRSRARRSTAPSSSPRTTGISSRR